MKLVGFSPSGFRYLCNSCGGQFVLRLSREKWKLAFGDKPPLLLTKKILAVLRDHGAEAIDDEELAKAASADMVEPDPDRFTWNPEEDDDESEE